MAGPGGPHLQKKVCFRNSWNAWSRLKSFQTFVFWPSLTDRKAPGLRSVSRVHEHVPQGSVTDRKALGLRSVRKAPEPCFSKVGYGP